MSTIWELSQASVRIGRADILSGVDLTIDDGGRLIVMVGPNGAGKSTLLGVLAGDLAVTDGSAMLDGRDLSAWAPRDLAVRRSVLTQSYEVSFGFSVRDVVEMGRYPWTSSSDVDRDEKIVADALRRTDTAHVVDRTFSTLSGGERARVSLARVLAQDTELILLDEPTAALDLRHTEETLVLARELADSGRTVVVVAHDLTLASAFADELIVVDRGRISAHGTPAEVLTPELIHRTYGLEVEVHQVRDRLVVVPIHQFPPPHTRRTAQ